MNHHLGTIVLLVSALFCLMTTLSSGVHPEDFGRRLGFKIADADGCNEIRAQYSGFFLAVSAVCGASLLGLLPRPATFLVLCVVFGGLIAGRLASLVIDRGPHHYGATIRALYAIDSIGFVLAIVALIGDNGRL
ncbi:MAG TPA: DUF4345 family protein [Xanthobacteraceae bacterium]|nr:DUF4345 family protein [Xanthobacteraceae bacterium]